MYRIYVTDDYAILGSENIDNFNIKPKMVDFEARILIGWIANTLNGPANQNA